MTVVTWLLAIACVVLAGALVLLWQRLQGVIGERDYWRESALFWRDRAHDEPPETT